MKRLIAAGIACLIPAGAALAQSATGEWRVEDGTADIRIVDCGGAIWGVTAWAKNPSGSADKDKNNPDPALRDRSLMGLPILINMQPAGGRWDGQIYNPEDGNTYDAHISLKAEDVLKVEGCFLGFLCGGQDWTRVPLPKGAPTDQVVCSRLPR